MCLSKAWFQGESADKPVMENITRLRIEDGRVVLSSLFGEERVEKATVTEVDFTHSRIILKRE